MPKEHTLAWKHLDFDQAAGRELNFVQWLGDADTRSWCKLMGLQSLYLISGIQGQPGSEFVFVYLHPHLNLYQDTTKRHFGPRAGHSWFLPCKHFQGWGVLHPILAGCQLHILDLPWDTFLVILELQGGREQRGWAWSARHRMQGHSKSDRVCEVWSCAAQGCSGSRLQGHSVLGERMLKDGSPWVYSRTSKLRLLGFLPWAQLPGHTQCLPGGMYVELVCTLLHHACYS